MQKQNINTGEQLKEEYNEGLITVCKSGCSLTLPRHWKLSQGGTQTTNNYYIFMNECYRGHIDMVLSMIEEGVKCCYGGLAVACNRGHMDIVLLMIEKGNFADNGVDDDRGFANAKIVDYNIGLENACYGGHMDIVLLMIAKGADDYNHGLGWACGKGVKWTADYTDIVLLMIKKGAIDWNSFQPNEQQLIEIYHHSGYNKTETINSICGDYSEQIKQQFHKYIEWRNTTNT